MDLATVGPSFVVPRAGAYSVRISAAFADIGGAQQKYVRVGAGVGAFTTMLVQASGWFSAVAGLIVSPSVEQELSFAAGDEVRVRYMKEWTTAVDVSSRVLTVTPVALS